MKAILGKVLVFSFCAGIAYWFGVFTTSFNTNLCYSSVIYEIERGLALAVASEDTDAVNQFQKKLSALPLHGYESNCEEVQEAANTLSDTQNQ